jgi:hypothetical protein
MEEHPRITFRPFLFSTIVMIIGGWGGLAILLNYTLPTLWPRWGFFALLVVALVGTALPAVWFLNLRFRRKIEANVIVRQSLFVGVYGATIMWLQLGRVLNLSITFGLALGLALIEYIILARERGAQPVETPSPR